MGANGSYDKYIGGVPENNQTHDETGHTINGHKVLLQKSNNEQTKNIMNSNSDSPIYLIAHLNNEGYIVVQSINIFEDHQLSVEIDLKFDNQSGTIKPYNGEEANTHSHSWHNVNGKMHRKYPGTHEAIPSGLDKLLHDIVVFNNSNKVKNGKN